MPWGENIMERGLSRREAGGCSGEIEEDAVWVEWTERVD